MKKETVDYLNYTTDTLVANVIDDDFYSLIAEESVELAKAALKIRRTLSESNPTDKDLKFEDAFANFLEEFADLINVVQPLLLPSDKEVIEKVLLEKRERWLYRLGLDN